MHSFEIMAEVDRRILRTVFRGVVTPEALAGHAQRSAELIAAMAPGFIVVADLSELVEMELNCVPHITRLMDLFRAAGVARVVRFIPDPDKDIGFTLLSHTHYRGRVPFQTVRTARELEAALVRN